MSASASESGVAAGWSPAKLGMRPGRAAVAWLVIALSVHVAAWTVPGFDLPVLAGGVVVAGLLAFLNAVLPPLVAALRLPWTLLLGFLLVLAVNAAALIAIAELLPEVVEVAGLWDAFVASLVIAAAAAAIDVALGINDDDYYSLRVVQRVARRQGGGARTEVPGILFLEIDGLAEPVLRRAIAAGSAPNMGRWLERGGYRLTEWEPDLSSQTGASQAGILLGSNEDIPAFRWVEKEDGSVRQCSSASDCALLESRLATGRGLLAGGGASRGNLFSGDADASILTVSRIDAERRANPGYRAFLANGFNVSRALALFVWELILEWIAAARQARRDVRPRGSRGGAYPLIRALMCVFVRDLVVFGVLTDMMSGRPAVYATFASYDEVAHHSGIERADTLEALRKLDQQLGRIERARRFAPRPYEIIVLSDHGQTQGATFRQRNGYGLDDLVRRSLDRDGVAELAGGDEQSAMALHSIAEATGGRSPVPDSSLAGECEAIVLGSGNLGLVYLMSSRRRLTLEEVSDLHPELIPALRRHPHIGWILVHSREHGPVVLGGRGYRHLAAGRLEGEDPLAGLSPRAADHLVRADGFSNAADLTIGSFYDPVFEEGCAFEELISFHGGLGGPQTRPFLLHPEHLPLPGGPLVGAAAVHRLLAGWRAHVTSG